MAGLAWSHIGLSAYSQNEDNSPAEVERRYVGQLAGYRGNDSIPLATPQRS